MRIAIVDDQKTLCNGLAQHIARIDDSFKIVGKAYDGYEGEKLIRLAKPDVAFLDIRMPFVSGIHLLERLRGDRSIRTKYIMLSAYSDFEYAQQALRLGAFDYMLKPAGMDSLEKAIRRAGEELRASESAGAGAAPAKEAASSPPDEDAIRALIESQIESVIQRRDIRNECVIRVLRVIGAEYMTPLSLSSLALRLNMSESYLSRIFSADVGLPLIKFLNHLRLDIAKEIMKRTEWNITDVARVSGFDNMTYFGRLFKGYTGYSASGYKQFIQQQGRPGR